MKLFAAQMQLNSDGNGWHGKTTAGIRFVAFRARLNAVTEAFYPKS